MDLAAECLEGDIEEAATEAAEEDMHRTREILPSSNCAQ